jgi:hypothetical protein
MFTLGGASLILGCNRADRRANSTLEAVPNGVTQQATGCSGPLQQERRFAESLSRPEIQPLALTEAEIDHLVAFIASLTSADYKEQGIKELALQRELSRTNRPQRDTARAPG